MHFFEQIGKELGKSQKVQQFPQSGIDFMNENLPSSPLQFSLHQNLSQLTKSLIPNSTDIEIRQYVIDQLRILITKALTGWCDSQIENNEENRVIVLPCGSCMSGTFLPNADIDIALFLYPVIANPQDVIERVIEYLTHNSKHCKNFLALPNARVPVLKFVVFDRIPVDLSIDELHGPLSVSAIKNIFSTMPYLLPAQLFLKLILYTKELDQPYKGGISSYMLILMLVA